MGLDERIRGMEHVQLPEARKVAVEAALRGGELLVRNLGARKVIQASTQHDVKLELDVRIQRLIERMLQEAFPEIPFLGEEEGKEEIQEPVPFRWVVDPIDGTVNYAHGIPHACVSIALQRWVNEAAKGRGAAEKEDSSARYETILGVVYDPFCDELWTADIRHKARLNGDPVRVIPRPLEESIICLGFGKSRAVLEYLGPALRELSERVRKIRIMGSAALALTYVASGRFDAYLEPSLQLWDIAAGGLIVQRAGGVYEVYPRRDGAGFSVFAHNGEAGSQLLELLPEEWRIWMHGGEKRGEA